MARVITFSRVFPTYHPRKGELTYFMEALQGSLYNEGYDLSKYISNPDTHMKNNEWSRTPKNHTIRSGSRWKVGDKFSPRVWSGKPYTSKMITIAPDIEIKKIWDITITTQDDDGEHDWSFIEIDGKAYTVYADEYLNETIKRLAKNDGLSPTDLFEWFQLQRTKKQRAEGEDKVFKGQIICWSDSVNY